MVLTYMMILFSLRNIVAVDWCSPDLECEIGRHRIRNTMCKYKAQTENDRCKDIRDVQTPDSRTEMLKLHNEYRNKMAGGGIEGWPKAANMMEMSWDDELEAVALRWAMQCKDEYHDKCRRIPRYKTLGQNYAAELGEPDYLPGSTETNFDSWMDEIILISDPEAMLNNFRGGRWGHFTQVIWAESFLLGCGSVRYEKDNWKNSADYCNYAPPGNVVASHIYEEGEPASKCPAGTSQSKQYTNLCASSQIVVNNTPTSAPGAADEGTSASGTADDGTYVTRAAVERTTKCGKKNGCKDRAIYGKVHGDGGSVGKGGSNNSEVRPDGSDAGRKWLSKRKPHSSSATHGVLDSLIVLVIKAVTATIMHSFQ